MANIGHISMTSAALGAGVLSFGLGASGAAKSFGFKSASVGMQAAGALAAS